jgi:hypothetical protein
LRDWRRRSVNDSDPVNVAADRRTIPGRSRSPRRRPSAWPSPSPAWPGWPRVDLVAQMGRGTPVWPSMAMAIPDQPSQAQYRGWRERAQAGPPAGMGAGVEGLPGLPAHAGVPRHRWGVFVGSGMVLAIGDLSSRCSPPRSPPRQHSSPVQVAYGNLCPIEIEVAVRLGWSGMASP